MQHMVSPEEQFHIVADVERTKAPLHVLKNDDTFAVFDPRGDILPAAGEQGLYHDGTRFLSRLELLLCGRRPLLLSSTISADNVVFTADLTNPDIRRKDTVAVQHGELHLYRCRVLWRGHCIEHVRVSNFGRHVIDTPVAILFDADYADVFEVRGTRRPRRGERLPDACGGECVLAYRGLDGIERRSRLRWTPHPDVLDPGSARFVLHLEPRATIDIELTITCESANQHLDAPLFTAATRQARSILGSRASVGSTIVGSNESLNRWLQRSFADLQMMLTETANGLYPYAGIPWFSTPFGRDGIITALQLLWANPAIARGVLGFLADTQATAYDDAQDAQPGKILHEMRGGEMAALVEVPFGRYYGSADATPLFVVLADAYHQRTADAAFIDRLWPHVIAALEWLQSDGDPDGDGFVEYSRRSESGLVQQGWKDSQDSIFHADGALAEPPIALCEIQGYAYAAWIGAARLAVMRGDHESAHEWRARAERLRARFDSEFWCEDLGTYALALDGRKRPCRVRTSNPGHCLFTGIASLERARRVATTLMSDASFAGWGIRTLSAGESRYNPMSYHNGSIWPHDNALAAAGLARYGLTGHAMRIFHAMFDLSQSVELHRLPELICGFHRREGEFPTLYPVACAPQAWAAGAVYMLLEACVGLRIDAAAPRVSFHRAVLPETIDWLQIANLSVGGASVDLRLDRHTHNVGVNVIRRDGDLEIAVVK